MKQYKLLLANGKPKDFEERLNKLALEGFQYKGLVFNGSHALLEIEIVKMKVKVKNGLEK